MCRGWAVERKTGSNFCALDQVKIIGDKGKLSLNWAGSSPRWACLIGVGRAEPRTKPEASFRDVKGHIAYSSSGRWCVTLAGASKEVSVTVFPFVGAVNWLSWLGGEAPVQEPHFSFVLATISWQETAILLNIFTCTFVTQALAAAHVLQAGLAVLLICKSALVEKQISKICLGPVMLRVIDRHGL